MAVERIPPAKVRARLRLENPWWAPGTGIDPRFAEYRPRAYFAPFQKLLDTTREVNRAIVLLGPRRIGKTVLIHHAIRALLAEGRDPRSICYVSVDHPVYYGLTLEELRELYIETASPPNPDSVLIFFDEVQYLRGWEIHLKALVDRNPETRLVVSGSAAAALRLKSVESGAGRFTEFILPPWTFHEYLELIGLGDLVTQHVRPGMWQYETPDIDALNARFVDYLNYGGYPEVARSKQIQMDPGRFVKSDIIDKVLLRDLPSLYGIQDIQELNSLFTRLAYNTSAEVSLEGLSNDSGVAKPTIKRYIEYLEAAFLVKTVERIDRSAKHFQRARTFKVYLTNPSMWSALISPVGIDDSELERLAETAAFAQWFHSQSPTYYARWDGGEVDIVFLQPASQKPAWIAEIKWSDRYPDKPNELRSAIGFCHANKLSRAVITTRTVSKELTYEGVRLRFIPTSLYAYGIGRNLVTGKVTLDRLSAVGEEDLKKLVRTPVKPPPTSST